MHNQVFFVGSTPTAICMYSGIANLRPARAGHVVALVQRNIPYQKYTYAMLHSYLNYFLCVVAEWSICVN